MNALTTEPFPSFELFGHVYVKPSDKFSLVYILLIIICEWALYVEICKVFMRCSLLSYGDSAVLVPCTFTIYNWPTTLVPTYKSRGTWKSLFFYFYLLAVYIGTLFLATPSMYPLIRGIAGVWALNIVLSHADPALLRERRPNLYRMRQFLTVLVTDREYRNLRLEEKDWNPVELDFTVSHSRTLANQIACALFAADDGEDLIVFGGGDIGRKGKRLVHVDKDVDFRIVKVRVPYSLVWYSVYKTMAATVQFVGTDEIDKCLIWLGIVSLISEIIVRWTPGPTLVVAVR